MSILENIHEECRFPPILSRDGAGNNEDVDSNVPITEKE
jgi:hypothetical protein